MPLVISASSQVCQAMEIISMVCMCIEEGGGEGKRERERERHIVLE